MISITILLVIFMFTASLAVDVLFNSFNSDDLIFTGDARVDSSVVQLTNNSADSSVGRVFYPYPFTDKARTDLASTSFVFSILPQNDSTPGFGFAYVYSNSTVPSTNLSAGQYFGLYSNTTASNVVPTNLDTFLAVEFDTGKNPELNDTSNNHVGININSPTSIMSREAGYYNSSTRKFVPVDLRSGQNIRAWIESGNGRWVNVTIAPVGVPRPTRPLISMIYPIPNNTPTIVFAGFSASRGAWKEEQRILAWSFSDERLAKDIDISNLPDFTRDSDQPSPSTPNSSSSSSLSPTVKVTVILSSVVFAVLLCSMYLFWIRKFKGKPGKEEDASIQEWELEYWPHRFSCEELNEATNGFSKDMLLGSGGFGSVYKGNLHNNIEIAVKCMNHDSNQGFREFMAEISSIGRLQHKNLVHLRGWCKKGQELMLVYDYMPNGSLANWIFTDSPNHLCWEARRKILGDVAEALNYLHHGWHDLVLHRDIKSSNILLDSNMCGRLCDFGLAKLYKNGRAPKTTRLVGTIGYMAPELVKSRATEASDVYSFGVLVLEVVSGRRPLEEEPILTEWVEELNVQARLFEAADKRIVGEYEVEDLEMVLRLGLRCCDPEPLLRPTIKEVCVLLVGAIASPSVDDVVIECEPRGTSGGAGLDEEVSWTSDLSPR